MAKVEIYTAAYCGYCHRAKALLNEKQVTYTEIPVDQHDEKRREMEERSQRRTVPQIFIDGQHIGGCDDLIALEQSGKLDKLLN